MRGAFTLLTLRLAAVLILVWSITVQAQRRGGGGGGGGDSDGSDEGDSDGERGDSGGVGPDEHCRTEARYFSPLWLHRWIGTYYNGTIDVSIRLNSSTTSCDEQNGVFETSLDGVLALLDPRYSGTSDSTLAEDPPRNPFIAALLGWPESTTEADLFATRDNGSVLRDNGYPHVVEFIFETLTSFFSNAAGVLPSDPITRTYSPTCIVQNVTDTDGGYAFDCGPYNQSGVPAATRDTSQFFIPTNACNGSSLYPLTVQERDSRVLGDVFDFNRVFDPKHVFRGEFDPTEADLTWEGEFVGMFLPDLLQSGSLPLAAGLPDSDGALGGSFKARFRGKVDEEHSFEMVVERGKNVTWVEDDERLEEQTLCRGSSGVLAPGGGMLAVLAIVVVHVVVTLV